jgi:hypothetical protein
VALGAARPGPDDFDHRDRHLTLGLTLGGAGMIRGGLAPGRAAALTAVLQSLGKKRGPADDKGEARRFHDALAGRVSGVLLPRYAEYPW